MVIFIIRQFYIVISIIITFIIIRKMTSTIIEYNYLFIIKYYNNLVLIEITIFILKIILWKS